MIPKRIIEKAVEGGWTTTKFQDFPSNEEIALDPPFWQALGKALGWERSDRQTRTEVWLEWKWQAHRLYDLVLQGQDTTEFWNELMK